MNDCSNVRSIRALNKPNLIYFQYDCLLRFYKLLLLPDLDNCLPERRLSLFDPGFDFDCLYDDHCNSKLADMDTAFVRADTTNLPAVDTYMLMEYMKNSDKHNVAEIRGAKALS